MPMAAKYIAPLEEGPVEDSLAEEQQVTSIEEPTQFSGDRNDAATEQHAPVADEVGSADAETVEVGSADAATGEVGLDDAETVEVGSADAATGEIGLDDAETASADEAVGSIQAEANLPEITSSEATLSEAELSDVTSSETMLSEETAGVADVESASSVETAAAAESPAADQASVVGEAVAVEDGEAVRDPAARPEELRLLEALLFASTEPLDVASLAKRMPDGVDVKAALMQLQADYAMRGVNLVRVASKWTFRTAGDLAWLMTRESTETRRLSRAAIEMLAIIAYHQPVTRAEIEEIRGVVTSKGTLDVLLETGWIRPRGRRKTPGRPLTFGTTEAFLSQFSLEALGDLPGLDELKGTGLLDTRLPSGFNVPSPSDDPALREDEEPLEPGDLELALAPAVEPEKNDES